MSKRPRRPKGNPLRKQLLEQLERNCELREKIRANLDESRETLVFERAMWEVLVEQPDVLEVTECASIEEVRTQRARRTAAAEENLAAFQAIEREMGRDIANLERMLGRIGGLRR